MLYPLGSQIIVKNTATNKQAFLEGHSSDVSCLAVSKDGRTMASGQRNAQVTAAHVLVWDLEGAKRCCDEGGRGGAGCLIHRLHQHLGAVQGLDFSFDDRYLATLGGQDDNALVIWEAETGTAICGSPAFDDTGLAVRWCSARSDRLVTAGNYHLRVWQVDVGLPKLHGMTAKMGTMRRVITSITVDEADEFAYCGTKTGEVLKFKIDRDPIMSYNDPDKSVPTLKAYSKERFGKGVLCVQCVADRRTGETCVVLGAGDGTVAMLTPALTVAKGKVATVMGAVTSVALAPAGDGFLVGTLQANRYFVGLARWDVELRATCHCGPVNAVVFPRGCSDLFITSSSSDIRIWNAGLKQELLRIQVPNLDCCCLGITDSGSTIVSGWTDGKVRAFFPESGRLKFVINDAHAEAVTALAICHGVDESRPPWRLLTGGNDGRVRIWNVTPTHQAMVHSLKEHRAPVLSITLSADNSQAVSASADGSCIIWDLGRCVRLNAFFEPTVFQAAVYHPDMSQILTCGSNFKISYWDAYDGNAIRVVDGGEAEMTALDIEDGSGERFVSGSADKLVKLWNYDDGIATAVGAGHSGRITAVKFSPDMKTIVSVGAEGAIFIWDVSGL